MGMVVSPSVGYVLDKCMPAPKLVTLIGMLLLVMGQYTLAIYPSIFAVVVMWAGYFC